MGYCVFSDLIIDVVSVRSDKFSLLSFLLWQVVGVGVGRTVLVFYGLMTRLL